MLKDPTQFRERFKRWKEGMPAYKNGRPVDKIRQRAYRNINPLTDYDIVKNAKEFISGDSIDYGDWIMDDGEGNKVIEFEDGNAYIEPIDDIWATYLQIPENKRRFDKRLDRSKYTPSKGDKRNLYYRLPLTESKTLDLIYDTEDLPINSNKVSEILLDYNLGQHTVGRGYDLRGEYRSYYDKWDLNPFSGKYQGIKIPIINNVGDVSLGIGKPVNIYDRIYLDDYYGVSLPTHSTYLPEVNVYGNNKNIPKFEDGKNNTLMYNMLRKGKPILPLFNFNL